MLSDGLQSMGQLQGGCRCSQCVSAAVQAFPWNSTSASGEDDPDGAEDGPLCPVCRAPMMAAEVRGLHLIGGHPTGSAPNTPSCRSCSHQLAGVLQLCPLENVRDMPEGGPASQPCLPAFMRMRIDVLRTGTLLEP